MVLVALIARVHAAPRVARDDASRDDASRDDASRDDAARDDAARDDAARAEAIRYANILTGVDPDSPEAVASGDGDDEREVGVDSDEETEPDDSATDRDPEGSDELRGLSIGGEIDDRERLAGVDAAMRDPSAPELAGHVTDELAALDAEPGAPGLASDDGSIAAASAGASETYESAMRQRRPSRLGRLDVGVAWRRRWSEPVQGMSHRSDEVWLVATWRR